jgi:hypothetical protein
MWKRPMPESVSIPSPEARAQFKEVPQRQQGRLLLRQSTELVPLKRLRCNPPLDFQPNITQEEKERQEEVERQEEE